MGLIDKLNVPVKHWENLEQANARYDAIVRECTRQGISVKEFYKKNHELQMYLAKKIHK